MATIMNAHTVKPTEILALAQRLPVAELEWLWEELRQIIAQSRPSFGADWADLCRHIQDTQTLLIDTTDPDEIVEALRQTRAEIFEEEYAHLYR